MGYCAEGRAVSAGTRLGHGGGSLGPGELLFVLWREGLQRWGSIGPLMTFSQFLMDSVVSNFAQHAHGIMLDELSLWFASMRSPAYEASPFKPPCGNESGFLEAL